MDAQAADMRQVAVSSGALLQFWGGQHERVAAAVDDFFDFCMGGEVSGNVGDFCLSQGSAASPDVFFAEAEAAVHGADRRDFPQDAIGIAVHQRGQW